MTLETQKANGYVDTRLPVNYSGEYGPFIDLGLAANPSGAAFEAQKLAEKTSTGQIAEYDEDPNHKDVKELLIEGIGLKGLTHESVILHPNGSYGAGDEVVRAISNHSLVRENRQTVLFTPSYSFPNVQQYTLRHGAVYQPLPAGNTPFQSDSLVNALKMNSSALRGNVMYIDYPNNPSGVADPDLLRSVVKHVSKNGGIPFVDLAFGEVLGDEFRRAMQYTIDHGGVCVGSLTKTQGLASLRAGYAVMNPDLSKKFYDGGARLVFGLPAYVKNAYKLLFSHEDGKPTLARQQAEKAVEYNKKTNEDLYAGFQEAGLGIAPTILETPIQVVIGSNECDNLYLRLACAGIKTESLDEYKDTLDKSVEGYGNRAVRLLTPRVGTLNETINRLKLAMTFSREYIKEKWAEKNLHNS